MGGGTACSILWCLKDMLQGFGKVCGYTPSICQRGRHPLIRDSRLTAVRVDGLIVLIQQGHRGRTIHFGWMTGPQIVSIGTSRRFGHVVPVQRTRVG